MSDKLPIAIVIPHAGLATPPELVGRVALTGAQIFNEADVYTDLIYDFRDRVLHWHVFPYARAIIDVNRPNTPMPRMIEGDGIVKRITSYGAAVYATGEELDSELEQDLIKKYWQPWHDTMAEIASDERVKLVLDCHSMAAVGPTRFRDTGQVRPRITASNLGDAEGNTHPERGHITAPPELTRFAAQKFGDSLADIPDLAPTAKPYGVNSPFYGGPIIWIHGGKVQPWLMIELNRATYIGHQTKDSLVSPPNTEGLNHIRENLWQAIVEIVEHL